MKLAHVSRSHQANTLLAILFIIMLAVPVSLRSAFAHEAPARQIVVAQAASSPSGQPLPYSQMAGSQISKPAPSLCYQITFLQNDYLLGGFPYGVAAGDFNGNGIPDLVTANYGTNDVSVLIGSGDGTFTGGIAYPAGTDPIIVVVADLFGDRIDDLIVINSGMNGVSYLQGGGDGTFFQPYYFDMGSVVWGAAVGDLNNDSLADLVTVSGTANNVSIRLNDGVGDLAPVTHISLSGTPIAVAISDLNGDTIPDLVTANSDSNNISVLLGNGNGTFQAPISFAAGDHPFAVAVGDLNGDGTPDLAAPDNYSNRVSVLLGNGDGTFQAPISFAVQHSPTYMDMGDFNDDGKLDLVVVNNSSSSVSVLVNNGDAYFQPAVNISIGHSVHAAVVSDLNRDGKADIATANSFGRNASVLINACASVTNTPTPVAVPTNTSMPSSTPEDTSTPLPTQTPGGPTATPQACTIQFADVAADNTFYPFVRCLACRGIIAGYECGGAGEPCNPANDPYFRASNPVTRGQIAKIVSNSAGFSDPVSDQLFEDVPPGSAFYPFVERLVAHEVIGGYACGGPGEPCGSGSLPYFRPASGATRGQITKIVANAAALTDPAPATYTFADVPVGSTFHVYVERLLAYRPGVMGGYPCGGAGELCDPQNRTYFRPTNPLTRGQTSKIVSSTFYPDCQTP